MVLILQVCQGYPKLYERATEAMNQAKKEGRVQPLFIRPSTQWYTSDERLEGDGSGVLSAPSISSRYGNYRYYTSWLFQEHQKIYDLYVYEICKV